MCIRDSVCCLPVVLSTGWELKKVFYGLSVSGRQVLVFMPFAVSVSYTHLDVYKRQPVCLHEMQKKE